MKIRRIAFAGILLLAALGAAAQSVEELQQQAAAAQADIDAANTLLAKTEGDRRDNWSRLQLVRNNIENYRKIIASLDGQVRLVNRRVDDKTQAIRQNERELSELKAEYAALIRAAYRSRQSDNVLSFLFAARDFNEVAQRLYYVKRYTKIRERKGLQIDSLSQRFQADVQALALQKDSLGRIVESRNGELANLQREEGEFRRIDTSLRSEARQYGERITAQQHRLKSIQDQIERLIAEAARRLEATPRSAAEEENLVRLTGSFAENRGKLPWPVGGAAAIYERYGNHPHPIFPNVRINKKEIDIAVERGASVRAVFDGEVYQIAFYPGANNTVLIRHGEYITVYTNLETVAVKVGDPVTGNQHIGHVPSDAGAGNYLLSFGIWKGMESYNPEEWISR